MDYSLKKTSNWSAQRSDCLVIPVIDSKAINQQLKSLDDEYQGLVKTLLQSGDIKTSPLSVSLVQTPNHKSKRLLFIGLGKKPDFATFRKAIASVQKQLAKLNINNAAIVLNELSISDTSTEQLLQQTAQLIETGFYKYSETLSKKAQKPNLKKVTVLHEQATASLKNALQQGVEIGQGMNLARQLGNLPGNICTPSYLADCADGLSKKYKKLSCKVLSEAQMKKLKMHSLLSVTAGTEEPAKFIIMEHKGGKAGEQPYVLVGKGVTFDSGGISLKPGAAMDEMKYDMCGAASVFGTMQAVSELDLKANIIGVVGAVENLPSGKATKPGDVVTSMSGQTIEILNTDAEGRLVLCDALTYVERFKPKTVIDIATLTGAAIVALGKHATALYSNNDKLSEQLIEAGKKTHDRAWPMPLWDDYDKQLSSNFADIANIGGPQAGSVTAACFLARFTKKYDWAHLDIAGPAWLNGPAKGATGRPVNLLVQYLIDQTA
jgi:leucyl aminopeptidase